MHGTNVSSKTKTFCTLYGTVFDWVVISGMMRKFVSRTSATLAAGVFDVCLCIVFEAVDWLLLPFCIVFNLCNCCCCCWICCCRCCCCCCRTTLAAVFDLKSKEKLYSYREAGILKSIYNGSPAILFPTSCKYNICSHFYIIEGLAPLFPAICIISPTCRCGYKTKYCIQAKIGNDLVFSAIQLWSQRQYFEICTNVNTITRQSYL